MVTKILLFWLPLWAGWVTMAFELPLLSLFIARLDYEEINLAAFGISYSFFLLGESPIIMLNVLVIRFAQNRRSLKKIYLFGYVILLIIIGLMACFALTPLFPYVMEQLLHMSAEVTALTKKSMLILLPALVAIGIRRLYQGVLMSQHRSYHVGTALAFRLIAVALIGFGMLFYSEYSGALIASIALSAGAVIEAIATRLLASKALRLITAETTRFVHTTYRELLSFYYPLSLTGMASLLVTPIVTIFLAQGAMPLQALAAFPVVNAFISPFKASAMSYQDVVVSFLKKKETAYIPLRNTLLTTIACMGVILSLIAYTPLIFSYFQGVIGVSEELTALIVPTARVFLFYPLLTAFVVWQRSLLITRHKTSLFTLATLGELAALTLSLFIFIEVAGFPNLLSSAYALIFGRIVSLAILYRNYGLPI